MPTPHSAASLDDMSLLPGIPDDIVHDGILARLPWYTRTAVAWSSKSLKQAMEGMDPKLTMKVDLEGRAVIFSEDGSMLLEDPTYHKVWRRLPNLLAVQRSRPDSIWATATDGMVVVWSNVNDACHARAVFKLDLTKPVVNWDAIEDSPVLSSTRIREAAIFRGHIYYMNKENDASVMLQYSLRTGQLLEHKAPEGVWSVWCAGDDRHLHSFFIRKYTIAEFDTVTFEWRTIFNMGQAFLGRRPPFVCSPLYPVSRLTSSILFDPTGRQWVKVTIDHPPCDEETPHMLVASFWGSLYAVCDDYSVLQIWKCQIDFVRKSNTLWRLLYTSDPFMYVHTPLQSVCWLEESI